MEKVTLSIADLTKEVATRMEEAGNKTSQKKIREVIDSIEAAVKANLKKADQNTTMEIKVFSGLTLVSQYVEAHEGRNPQTREVIVIPGKNRCKAKFTQSLKDAIA